MVNLGSTQNSDCAMPVQSLIHPYSQVHTSVAGSLKTLQESHCESFDEMRDPNDLSIVDSRIIVDSVRRREGFRLNQQREVFTVVKSRFLESVVDLVVCYIAVNHCARGKE